MLEPLQILQEKRTRGISGSEFTVRYTIAAKPIDDDVGDEEEFDDTSKVDNITRVRIHRTPNTETDVVVSALVIWRGSRWVITSRQETRYRVHYDLTLEATS